MSARTQLSWEVPPAVLARNLGVSVQKAAAVLRAGLVTAAAQMAAFAKSNHPWQNQTGAAEETFRVVASGLQITISHGVYYGVYLEYKYGGKWGVIPATMEYGSGPVRTAMMATIKAIAS